MIELVSDGLMPSEDLAWIQARLERLRALVAPNLERIDVKFVADAEMARLHGQFLGDATTTDVITFVDGGQVDLALCVCEARRRAAELGHALREELLLYGLHGLLHAVGFDDRTPEDFARMHAEEDRLLAAIGVGARFAPKANP